ncbi:MAG TPA: universal stress protein [Candidatus Acidoferrum sp.]|nr:universal stress protein [Candidatus Acidoferrum sp.]
METVSQSVTRAGARAPLGLSGASRAAVVETILLATDLTAHSRRATDQAIEFATTFAARLLIVNVLDGPAGRPLTGRGPIRPVEEREARAVQARDVVQRARAAGARATFLVWEGEPGDGILGAADAERADLIIVGTRGRSGVSRSILGSISDHVIRHARCPVLVVRPQDD